MSVPSPQSPNFKMVMQGIKAYLAKPTKQAAPMNMQLLQENAEIIDFENPYEMCNYSAILTGFYLILRSSNLVPTSTRTFNTNEQFTRWHVGIDGNEKIALFLIEWSKTIQHCRKELWVPVMKAKDSKVCLITILKRYFSMVPAEDQDLMFCFRNKDGELKALMYGQLSEQLKDWVKKTGREDDSKYTLHGLRWGGTSHAFEMGIKPEYIKNDGRLGIAMLFQVLGHRLR